MSKYGYQHEAQRLAYRWLHMYVSQFSSKRLFPLRIALETALTSLQTPLKPSTSGSRPVSLKRAAV